MKDQFELIASNKTKATIPEGDWALMQDLLPNWAGKNIVLVSAADLDPQKIDEEISPLDWCTREFHSLLSTLHLPRNIRYSSTRGFENVLRDAANQRFRVTSRSYFENTGVISLIGNPADTKRLEISRLAGLLDEQAMLLADVPGRSRDWYFAILAHEAGHLTTLHKDAQPVRYLQNASFDVTNRNENAEEIRADSIGLSNYFNLCARNNTFNSEVPQAILQLRAIGTLRYAGNTFTNIHLEMSDHATNPALTIVGSSVQIKPDITAGEIGAAVISINTRTDLLLGLELATPETLERGRQCLAEILLCLKTNSSEDFEALPKAIGSERFNLLMKLQQDPQGCQAPAILLAGKIIAKENPLTQYAAVRFLYDSAEFETDLEKLIAKQFLDAFEKFIPSAKSHETQALIAQFKCNRNKTNEAAGNLDGLQYVRDSLALSQKQLAEKAKDTELPPANHKVARISLFGWLARHLMR